MFTICYKRCLWFTTALIAVLWAGWMIASASAQSPHHSGGIAGTGSHAGQITKDKLYHYEVVFLPQETRVYLYDAQRQPLSMRGVQGQVVTIVRAGERAFPHPLRYVAAQAGSKQQGYLAAAVDVRKVRDGEMRATFELTNLPSAGQSRAAFQQTFALARTRPQVVVAALTQADQQGIARQKRCPVMGGQLGAMGAPVKVLVDGQPLYLCCRGCVGEVEKDPELYLTRASQVRRSQ